VPERKRNAYAATPGYREEPWRQGHIATPPPSSPSNCAIPERQDRSNGEPQEERQKQSQEKPEQNRGERPFSSSKPATQGPCGTEYTLKDLFALAHIAGDRTGLRIAIACLPDQNQCIVTMAFGSKRCVQYQIEEVDVLGRPVSNNFGGP
jgi:hypothetical protein